MKFHPRIMTERQKKVLHRLNEIPQRAGFYLAGGTAVALQLGHRHSVDFDFFSNQNFDPLELAATLRDEGLALEVDQAAEKMLFGSISQVKLSFIYYRYPLLDELTLYPQYKIMLAGLPDLSAMKLAAITQRGAKKDFIDLYALLRSGIALPEMLSFYQQKYQSKSVAHVLTSLTYFEDAEADRLPKMHLRATWREMKNYLRQQVVNWTF